jgi:hypothetical protein
MADLIIPIERKRPSRDISLMAANAALALLIGMRVAFLGMGQVDLDRGFYLGHAYGVGSGCFVVCGGKVRPPGTKRGGPERGTAHFTTLTPQIKVACLGAIEKFIVRLSG